jgi:hypothetical protein
LAKSVFTVIGKTTHGFGINASRLLVREDHIPMHCFVESLGKLWIKKMGRTNSMSSRVTLFRGKLPFQRCLVMVNLSGFDLDLSGDATDGGG